MEGLNGNLYTDLYQLSMGQAYFDKGQHEKEASFDYFFRKIPFENGYVITAGLEEVLESLQDFHFRPEELEYLSSLGFKKEYLNFLKGLRFSGDIYAVPEGSVVFPYEPVIKVVGPMVEAQLIETMLLNQMNFQSLIATKAARIRLVSGDRPLAEFGMRRAQGWGAMQASRAAVIGGFDSTSNVLAGQKYGIPVTGTMAHSYIQSHDDELTAFRNFAETRPENCVLLIDTYNTLRSGLPNAITVAREMRERGQELAGIRLDSGDLAYLSKEARKTLDNEGFSNVKIVASNQLDEGVIKSLQEQNAAIDIYGVGTNLVVGKPNSALDGVYKLAFADGSPRLKISENIQKLTLPGMKQVWRYMDNNGKYLADAIALDEEEAPELMVHPYEPDKSMSLKGKDSFRLLEQVVRKGERISEKRSLENIKTSAKENLSRLPVEHKRFNYPHIYKVGISEQLLDLRQSLKNKSTAKL
ncbi:nicotinate phosphoribosyltransferase [Marinigracilibium pacificum]|uniref:Nicotinate phosphoribosyltransferase n=1 Tax=Marinigracilibium pacificum TaxID=2729599 RepID=A0A848IZQ3_9BACT|nr:nicotinate phosphoribosyltransferase [Marinigracilibium pacificum]NMM48765.1 nicotinate phosphoribosyltransferase [Marinigracilibium pacificum]